MALDGGMDWVACKGKVAKLPGMEFGEGVLWDGMAVENNTSSLHYAKR